MVIKVRSVDGESWTNLTQVDCNISDVVLKNDLMLIIFCLNDDTVVAADITPTIVDARGRWRLFDEITDPNVGDRGMTYLVYGKYANKQDDQADGTLNYYSFDGFTGTIDGMYGFLSLYDDEGGSVHYKKGCLKDNHETGGGSTTDAPSQVVSTDGSLALSCWAARQGPDYFDIDVNKTFTPTGGTNPTLHSDSFVSNGQSDLTWVVGSAEYDIADGPDIGIQQLGHDPCQSGVDFYSISIMLESRPYAGVHRVSENDGGTINFVNHTEGSIPNGTLDVIPFPDAATNGGNYIRAPSRVLIMWYFAEIDTPGFAPTITIGGQSPAIAFVNLDTVRATDTPSAVWLWKEEEIRQFTPEASPNANLTAIATGGTWPVTSAEHWGWCVYANVDQSDPLVLSENYYEQTSAVFHEFDTGPCKQEDLILWIAATPTGTTTIGFADEDLLNTLIDDQVSGYRAYVLEGRGAPNFDAAKPDGTTKIGLSTAGSITAYGLVLRYESRGLVWNNARHDFASTHTGNTNWVDVNTAAEIQATSQSPKREYLALRSGLVGGNNSGQRFNHDWNNNNRATSSFDDHVVEPRRTNSSTGSQYFFFERIIGSSLHTVTDEYGNLEGYESHFRTPSATDTVHSSDNHCSLIDLSAMHLDNWRYAEDLTSYTALESASWTDGVSTVLGDGDWLVFVFVHSLVDSGTAALRIRLEIDSVVQGQFCEFEGENTAELWCHGFIIPVVNANAGDVAQISFQVDSLTGSHDVDCNRIFALNLDQFDDHFIEYDPTDTTINVADSDFTVIEHTHTANVGYESDWMIGGTTFISSPSENTHDIENRMEDSSGTELMGVFDRRQNSPGIGDVMPISKWGPYHDWTNGVSETFTFICRQESTMTTWPIAEDNWIWGFSMTFKDPQRPYYDNNVLRPQLRM